MTDEPNMAPAGPTCHVSGSLAAGGASARTPGLEGWPPRSQAHGKWPRGRPASGTRQHDPWVAWDPRIWSEEADGGAASCRGRGQGPARLPLRPAGRRPRPRDQQSAALPPHLLGSAGPRDAGSPWVVPAGPSPALIGPSGCRKTNGSSPARWPRPEGRAEGRAPPEPSQASQLLRILSGRGAGPEPLSQPDYLLISVSCRNVCLC